MFVVISLPLVIQIVGNQIKVGLAAPAQVPTILTCVAVGVGVPTVSQPETQAARLRRLLITPGVN
jgi:hypothetical protein